jgi:hypothetical protein
MLPHGGKKHYSKASRLKLAEQRANEHLDVMYANNSQSALLASGGGIRNQTRRLLSAFSPERIDRNPATASGFTPFHD